MIREAGKVIAVPATTTSIAAGVLVAFLDAQDQPPDDVLAAAGTTRAALAGDDTALPLTAFRELWARAHRLAPDIGLTLVDRFAPGQMHLLLHLALRSEDVEGALRDACRHAGATTPGDRLALARAGAQAQVTFLPREEASVNPWIVEHYFALAVHFLRQATGRALPIHSVAFAAPAQAPLDAYRRCFGVTPHFGAAASALAFDAQALAWPLLTRDAYLHGILERVAGGRSAPAEDLAARARQAMTQRLLAGTIPTPADIAAACCVGARALRDRLARDSTSFRQLLDEARRDLAREHFERGLSVAETAYLLGFSEPAAFQHACRRWFDAPAGEVRRRVRTKHRG